MACVNTVAQQLHADSAAELIPRITGG